MTLRLTLVVASLLVLSCNRGDRAADGSDRPVEAPSSLSNDQRATDPAAEAADRAEGVAATANEEGITPTPRLRAIGTIETGSPVRSISVDASGRIAVFETDGTVQVHVVTDEESLVAGPAGIVTGGPVVGAWYGDDLVAAGPSGSLWRWEVGEVALREVDRIRLPGSPVDARVVGSEIWVLSRDDDGSEVLVFAQTEGGQLSLVEGHRIDHGAVGLFDIGASIVVPCFGARSFFVFDAGTRTVAGNHATSFRPVGAARAGASIAVISSNSNEVTLLDGALTSTAELPEPVTLIKSFGDPTRTYVHSGATGRLQRLAEDLSSTATSERYRLVTDMVWSEFGLLVSNADGPDGVALLDPDTLMLRDSRRIDGRPAWIRVGGAIVAVGSPQEARVDVFVLVSVGRP